MIVLFVTSVGCIEVLTQNCNKQTHKKRATMYILLSYETMIRHLTLTAFASAAIIFEILGAV